MHSGRIVVLVGRLDSFSSTKGKERSQEENCFREAIAFGYFDPIRLDTQHTNIQPQRVRYAHIKDIDADIDGNPDASSAVDLVLSWNSNSRLNHQFDDSIS